MSTRQELKSRPKQIRLIIFQELRSVKGIAYSRMQLSRLMKAGIFPQAIRLSSSRIAWVEAEVDAWIAAKAEARAKANNER
jgi:prophage regulatory protein